MMNLESNGKGRYEEYPQKIKQMLKWGTPKLFIAWPVLWSLLHITTLALQSYFNPGVLPSKWFSKLTNWSYLVLTIYSVVESVTVVHVFINRKDIVNGEADSTPWFLKLVWILYCLTTTTAIAVGLLFYLLLNDGDNDAGGILKHFINVVFVILNVLLTRKPFHFLHFYIPVAYSLIYVLFTLIYQKGFDQEKIYPMLDWNDIPNVFLYSLGIPLLFIPLLVFLLFMLTILRDTVGNQCKKVCKKTDTDTIV